MRSITLKLTVCFLLLSSTAIAHPMGNFSINHHSTIELERDGISIRYILDFAEIPTYQMFPQGSQQARALAEEWIKNLRLTFDDVPAEIRLNNVSAATSMGAGGLSTLKVVMDLSASWKAQPHSAILHFKDDNFAERIGWKEIVIRVSGFEFPDGNPFAEDRSNALINYPADLLSTAPAVVEASLKVAPSGSHNSRRSAPP